MFSPLIKDLVKSLQCFPGIGPKSSQRIAIHLLQKNKKGAGKVAQSIEMALKYVVHCKRCRILCESDICDICSDNKRDSSILCIVESPMDVYAFEQTHEYRGVYFVLSGHLSPIDGIGPEEIGIQSLLDLVNTNHFSEVIIAISSTVEGEATAFFISEQLKSLCLEVSRIAQGVPIGGELEFLDGGTLIHALLGRKKFN